MPAGGDLVVAGVGAIPVERDLSGPIPDLCARVAREALADAHIPASEVDGLFVTPASLSGEPWMMFAASLGEYLGFTTKSLVCLENGGATALLALRAALDAIALGRVGVALVLATDTRPLLDTSHFEAFVQGVTFASISLYGPVNGLLGFGAPIAMYAMSAQRYMHEHGVSETEVAQVSVALREHARHHPLAQFRDPITVDDVMASRVLCPPVRLLQAAGISSGAVAAVVTSAERAVAGGRPLVRVRGWGEHHHPSHFIPRQGSLTRSEAVVAAANGAYADAGVAPGDIDVAEVYGVFGATELIAYEDLGFCDRGRAARWVADGRSTFGGDVAVNPSGGRLSFGHPAGATPLYELAEVVRQLRHEAPGRQADGARLGLVQAEHGMTNGAVVMVLEGEG